MDLLVILGVLGVLVSMWGVYVYTTRVPSNKKEVKLITPPLVDYIKQSQQAENIYAEGLTKHKLDPNITVPDLPVPPEEHQRTILERKPPVRAKRKTAKVDKVKPKVDKPKAAKVNKSR